MNARTLALVALSFALPLGGCASSSTTSSTMASGTETPFDVPATTERPGFVGLQALADEDFETARTAFLTTIDRCGTSSAGENATILLATAAVDPRHDEPDLAAALTSSLLAQPYRSDWATRMAESLYLVARSVGGDPAAESIVIPSGPPDQFPDDCSELMRPDPTFGDSTALPSFDTPSWPARLWRRTSEARTLEGQVDSLTAELDRIRETLRQ